MKGVPIAQHKGNLEIQAKEGARKKPTNNPPVKRKKAAGWLKKDAREKGG